MKRKLFSANIGCLSNCSYCFAKWENYNTQPEFINWKVQKDYEIIYPCCDGDFFKDVENVNMLEKYISTNKSPCIVSFSTKNFIRHDILKQLSRLNQKLVVEKRGFIKIGVSITNMSMIDEIEQFTLPYKERIELLQKIYENGIQTALVIRPILPFICEEEYYKIIDDSIRYTRSILLGDLYINKSTEFYKKYIKSYSCEQRMVEWLDDKPIWSVIESNLIKENLKKYVGDKNALVFESDIDLLKSMYDSIILGKEGIQNGKYY